MQYSLSEKNQYSTNSNDELYVLLRSTCFRSRNGKIMDEIMRDYGDLFIDSKISVAAGNYFCWIGSCLKQKCSTFFTITTSCRLEMKVDLAQSSPVQPLQLPITHWLFTSASVWHNIVP